MITAGVDIGSATAKAAVFDSAAGQIMGVAHQLTGWSAREAGEQVLRRALDAAGVDSDALRMVVGTGYGRIALPFADERITEISCHARGAHFVLPGTRTVIDIGGQDSKAIALDEAGNPENFAMNDRCAAGTGRFLEVMARVLGAELTEFGALALESESPAQLSSVCTVFAESEVIGLIAEGVARRDIAAGLCRSVAQRVAVLASQVGVRRRVLLTGGVALNDGVLAALNGILPEPVSRADAPHLTGAIGAAVIAAERVMLSG